MFGSGPMEDKVPLDHPLRKIRADFDLAFSRLASAFESSYGQVGNVSYPPAVLLRAHLLRALYSIRSERALCEQIDMNAGFRWFVGLDWDDKVFDHSTLSFNRSACSVLARRRLCLAKWFVWRVLASCCRTTVW